MELESLKRQLKCLEDNKAQVTYNPEQNELEHF